MVTTMWARIDSGAVAEITDIDPEGRFHPSIEWVACDEQVAVGWIYDGGEFSAPLETPIAEVADQAMARINAGYQAQMGKILNEYPQAETLTFDKQEREARQWQADNSVATPYIDAMLAERPLDKAELVDRILAKADAFTMASGMATGKRQRLEDEIKAALDAEDRAAIEAITW